MISNLYKPVDVAQILGISKSLAYRLIAQGSLPAVKFGRTVRVRPQDLDRFITESLTRKDASKSTPIESSDSPIGEGRNL